MAEQQKPAEDPRSLGRKPRSLGRKPPELGRPQPKLRRNADLTMKTKEDGMDHKKK